MARSLPLRTVRRHCRDPEVSGRPNCADTAARQRADSGLAVEGALHAHQHPKLERYDNTFFVAMRTAVYVEHEQLTPTTEVIATGETMAFLGADSAASCAVSAQCGRMPLRL
ncbi:hypothetical protein SSP24_76680 [Streptomyces spinoverrucosus]|uniref:Uncharacterized protein n=1 Tax=Streptomyces spinoverrucosus TaxID=284043 RepID=A0A4Y3VTQ7_9ACTN|nr:hypothetical protein SSP24_76680 [Streptomyces spinoverrucosus]GHB75148.1 hypothetical protein GCM10010397_51880 [Streptomyces spinoverrucosus]